MLHLGLEDFPSFEPIHIIAPIGATFLWQRATQMKGSSKRPRVESSIGASRPPTSVVDPLASSLGDTSIRSMLDIVMIVQAAHG